MTTFKQTGPYHSPPPTPKPPSEIPRGLSNPHPADSIISRFPQPPAAQARSPSRQQQYNLGSNEIQRSRLMAPDPPTNSPRSKAPNSPMPTPSPHLRQLGLSPFYPEFQSTEVEPPSNRTMHYRDTSPQPTGRSSRLGSNAGISNYQTILERPVHNLQQGSGQRGYPPGAFFHQTGSQQAPRSNSSDDTGSSGYPSPLSLGSQLAPSPFGWASSSFTYGDQNSGGGYLPTYKHGPTPPNISVPPPSSGGRDLLSPTSIVAGSIASSSSGSSAPPRSPASSSDSGPSPKPAFVFPGSRSTARPKVSNKTGTPQKVKVKKGKKGDKGRDDDPALRKPTSNPSPPPDPSPTTTHPDLSLARAGSNLSTQTSSSSSSSRNPASGFIYPPSRSVNHPNGDPLLPRRKGDATKTDAEGKGKPKFRGLGIWSKKKRGSIASFDSSNTARGSLESTGTIHVGPTSEYGGTGAGSSDGGSLRSEGGREEPVFREPRLTPSPYLLPPVMGLNEKRKQGRGKGNPRSYPLDPYDSVLLESDRHTGALLRKLNRTNAPSFHSYGNLPPRSVLDLGCGQGHWVLDAAMTWKRYGTHITGFDMVDIMKPTRARAASQGVADNITFVRGNFLDERLPFDDGSFDFIRMSSLGLCIPYESWEGVLREVFRVLILGGRLELIDDNIFFPYGKALSLPKELEDDSITSGILASYGQSGQGGATNRGMRDDETSSEADTATLHDAPQEKKTSISPKLTSHQSTEWDQQQVVSKDIETLFEHLLTQKYGIHVNPSSFILTMLKEVSGHAREIATMHLTLAPSGRGNEYANQDETDEAFADCPGLILWPSTLITMPPAEIEVHASKHLKTLLSCKTELVKHAVGVTEFEGIDEESVSEAIWEYEGFLNQRFYPPPGTSPDLLDSRSPTPQGFERKLSDSRRSSRMSMLSGISVSTENRDAMFEYQLDFREHFVWNDGTDDTPPESPILGVTEGSGSRSSTPVNKRIDRASAASPVSTIAPPYSPIELTHVRTFRVFEAIKLNETTLGPSSGSSS